MEILRPKMDATFFQGRHTFVSGKQLGKLTISNYLKPKVIRGWVSVLLKASLLRVKLLPQGMGLLGPKPQPV